MRSVLVFDLRITQSIAARALYEYILGELHEDAEIPNSVIVSRSLGKLSGERMNEIAFTYVNRWLQSFDPEYDGHRIPELEPDTSTNLYGDCLSWVKENLPEIK